MGNLQASPDRELWGSGNKSSESFPKTSKESFKIHINVWASLPETLN